MRFLQHENGNLKKNALNKIKILCHLHIFESNIVRVLSETNLQHENGNLKKNALSKIKSLCHADSKHENGNLKKNKNLNLKKKKRKKKILFLK
jgi:hypothetical protein